MKSNIIVGTADWPIPREVRGQFPDADSNLARYAKLLNGTEINSTFYRPHRASTFERWTSSVPKDFRFCAKLPKAITHEHRLVGVSRLLEEFAESVAPLGARLDCVLAQLPPSLAFERRPARAFLTQLRARFQGRNLAIEPRHVSWFEEGVDELLRDLEIARVAADPPVCERGAAPGGWQKLVYFRLHGSPRMYYSPYDDEYLRATALTLRRWSRAGVRCWCVFDNTASGAATGNALRLRELLRAVR